MDARHDVAAGARCARRQAACRLSRCLCTPTRGGVSAPRGPQDAAKIPSPLLGGARLKGGGNGLLADEIGTERLFLGAARQGQADELERRPEIPSRGKSQSE